MTLLVVELVRQRAQLESDRRRASTLQEMSMVGRRVGRREVNGLQLELEPIVTQILKECRDLIDLPWLHLEIADPDVDKPSWRMGPGGVAEEGLPHPPEAPPALPGLHRRRGWRVVERALESGERTVATLRMWTDPRKTDPERIRLLDSLLPQLASLLAAVLAERRAGRDALPGVATRSILEERLSLI
jgi:hypothetical protein